MKNKSTKDINKYSSKNRQNTLNKSPIVDNNGIEEKDNMYEDDFDHEDGRSSSIKSTDNMPSYRVAPPQLTKHKRKVPN